MAGHRRLMPGCWRAGKTTHGLLLQRHSGGADERRYHGRVADGIRNTHWYSDGFEIGCDNGERVRVAYLLNYFDSEAVGFVTTTIGSMRAISLPRPWSIASTV